MTESMKVAKPKNTECSDSAAFLPQCFSEFILAKTKPVQKDQSYYK